MSLFATEQETSMSDDTSKSGGQDRQRINVNQDYELRDWAKSLNTTPERVKEAVQAVGDRADKVREYLSAFIWRRCGARGISRHGSRSRRGS
jgi:hypothetical protein